MAFLDTLKQFGLWPQQQGPSQQDNPYGLDEGMMRQARMQSLSNLGSQIMAASVRQTPAQRADLMAGFDMSGGYQDNLLSSAQMKIMGDKMRDAREEDQRDKAAKVWLEQKIGSMPDSMQKRNAMIYLQLGDVQKAAEMLTAGPGEQSALQEKVSMLESSGVPREQAIGIATGRFHVVTDPFTNTQRIVDLGGNDVTGGGAGGMPAQPSAAVPQDNGQPAQGSSLTPDMLTPGTTGVDAKKTAEKAVVERNTGLRTNAEGAINFLTKIKGAEATLTGMNDSDFGPLQGQTASDGWLGTANTAVKSGVDWLWSDNSIGRQDLYKRDLADLELDVANMKLKGTGTITDTERQIARQTLGGLTSADKATAAAALKSTKVEAAIKIRDGLRAGVISMNDLASAGVDPNEVAQILVEAGAVDPAAAQNQTPASPKIKIRQISPGAN
jgi:hypothetical protein